MAKGKGTRGTTVSKAASQSGKAPRYPGGTSKKTVIGTKGGKASGSIKGQKNPGKTTGYTFPPKKGSAKGAKKQLPHLNKPKKS